MFETHHMSRAHATASLEKFLPKSGRAYAHGRNTDHGPGQHHAVSCLSPYFRRRLITEGEAIKKTLSAQSFSQAEKYIQEIFWRTYFKGWMEMRPSVWHQFLGMRHVPDGHETYQKAISGQTGIACFDAWIEELRETGYLHNHARMWTASIWIFTLRLPWAWGADFFLTHLADGDPASNTLGWRWVAGLHSRGKHYLARADNIDSFTNGRFAPYGQLNEQAVALEEMPPAAAAPLSLFEPTPKKPSMLVMTAEDCSPQTHDFGVPVVAAASLPVAFGAGGQNAAILALDAAAMTDGLSQCKAHFDVPIYEAISAGADAQSAEASLPEGLLELAKSSGAEQCVMLAPPVGFWSDNLAKIKQALAQAGLPLYLQRRTYDAICWPHAKKGFFPFKEKIPSFIRDF